MRKTVAMTCHIWHHSMCNKMEAMWRDSIKAKRIYRHHPKTREWWIGWVKEVSGVICQEHTYDELIESLHLGLKDILEYDNEQSGNIISNNDYQEVPIYVWCVDLYKKFGVPSSKTFSWGKRPRFFSSASWIRALPKRHLRREGVRNGSSLHLLHE